MPHPIEDIRKVFSLTSEEESHILSLMEERSFRRGERIEAVSLMRAYGYFILQGMARVYYVRKGCDCTYSFALEDEYIVLSPLLMTDPDEVVCIEFLEPTTVLFIPHRKMGENLDSMRPDRAHDVFRFIISAIIKRLRLLEERMIMLQTATATERYRWMKDRYPRVLERATMTQVASFLGMTKETLYRIRSNTYRSK